jgi:hypothetical protein
MDSQAEDPTLPIVDLPFLVVHYTNKHNLDKKSEKGSHII